jgi:hypothetical protein
MSKPTQSGTSIQTHFDFAVQVQNDVNGIEMGVLENGVAYLTQSGLGKICGTTHSRISEITREWEEHYDDEVVSKGRLGFIRDYLFSNGYRERQLYIKSKQGNKDIYAYPARTCSHFACVSRFPCASETLFCAPVRSSSEKASPSPCISPV